MPLNAPEAGQGRHSPRALWMILIALLIGAILVALVAAEFGIRWLQGRKYGTAARVEDHLVIDPAINLRVPRANLHFGRIETNSLGFRGPEIQVPKPAGRIRIAFLGASTTWCAEVSGNDKVWPHLVVDDLRRAFPNADIDYVNGGVPGFTTKSSLKNLEHRVAPLRPDIIVIYHAINDMSLELRGHAASRGLTGELRENTPSWLATKSLLWDLAEKNVRIWLAQRKVEASVGRLEMDAESLGEPFRRDLTALVQAARKTARVVFVATFSTRLRADQGAEEQLRAAASNLYYMPFMTPEGLLAAYGRYNEIIREVTRDAGVVLIGGEAEIPGDAQHFTDSVHFTDAGSRAMATRVSSVVGRNPQFKEVLER